MADGVDADFSQVDNLAEMLARAAVKVAAVRAAALDKTASEVRTEASATAASYPHATGALASSVTVTGSALSKRVGSDLKEGYFLEFGSPSTGGPRPWLTGPAAEGAQRMLKDLSKAGEPW